ncbi:hypothetical protein V6Z12_D03G173100 [Gossypium hirsutum]
MPRWGLHHMKRGLQMIFFPLLRRCNVRIASFGLKVIV